MEERQLRERGTQVLRSLSRLLSTHDAPLHLNPEIAAPPSGLLP
jgi:hypothetical protein